MPSGGGGAADDTALMEKPKFQAIVLADAFDSCRLDPLSSSSSSSVIHLNTIPLLEYAMDCLAGNGVDEVFVVCTKDEMEQQVYDWQRKTISAATATTSGDTTNTTAIEETTLSTTSNNNNKTSSNSSTVMQVTCIKDTNLTNAGDALRELYRRNVIKENGNDNYPFLLMFGDTITNINVLPAVQQHIERKKLDSAAIMTLIFKETSPESPIIPSSQDDLMIAIDPTTKRIIAYDNTTAHDYYDKDNEDDDDDDDDDKDADGADDAIDGGNPKLTIPCSFIGNHVQVDVHTKYFDTGMAICSPEVLARFEDEFDNLHISKDFVTNCVAEEEEGLQTRIHAYFAQRDEYAARVIDFATYHAISQDLLCRWCYPMVPDNAILLPTSSSSATSRSSLSLIRDNKNVILEEGEDGGEEEKKEEEKGVSSSGCYKLFGHPYLYKQKTSIVARSSTVTGPGMLGHKCHIADQCTISSSVIGNYCKVESNVTIQNSHLWDHVIVKAGATINQSIIAQNVIIEENATVSQGCVIGEGCIIGKGITVPPFTRITLVMEDDDSFGDDDDYDDDDDDDDPFGGDFDGNINRKSSAKSDSGGGTQKETDSSLVGPDGKGHAWKSKDTERIRLESIGYDRLARRFKRQNQQMANDNEEDDFSHLGGLGGGGLGPGGSGGADDEEELEQAFSAYTEGAVTFEDRPSGVDAIIMEQPMVFGRQKGVNVVEEMKDICMEFEDEPASGDAPNMENLAIELNSYKFSQNATYSDCTMASILAILQKCEITKSMTDGKLVSTFTNKIKVWAPLLTKLSVGITEEKAIIYGLEQAATVSTNSGGSGTTELAEKLSSSNAAFRFLLQILHDKEVLSEEAILAWASERRKDEEEGKNSAVNKLFQLASVQDFLEWLEAESEEDDDDDDDDEEEEDSD